MSLLKTKIYLETRDVKVVFAYKHVLKDAPLNPIPITNTTCSTFPVELYSVC